MIAYLINTTERTITEVEYSGNYKDIYKLCNFGIFTTVELTSDGDTLFVDDEGLLHGPVYNFFGYRGYAQPLAGNGLILGCDEEGESTAPKNPIEFFRERLCWVEMLTDTRWSLKPNSGPASGGSLEDIQVTLGSPL